MRVLQGLLLVLRRKSYHVVVLPCLLVHGDGHICLVHRQEHLLGFFVPGLCLQFLRLLYVQQRDLVVRHVLGGESVGLVPLVVGSVHLEDIVAGPCLHVKLLGVVQLFDVGVVLAYLLEVGLRHLRRLVAQELHCLGPESRVDCGLDGLLVGICLYEVVDTRLHLLDGHQVVAPLLFELLDVPRVAASCQVQGLSEGIPVDIGL